MTVKNRFRPTSNFLDTVEQRWEQMTADSMDVVDDVRLYRDKKVIDGIIISSSGDKWHAGTQQREIEDELSNKIIVNSYCVRFIDTTEFSNDNPHSSKLNPLDAKSKDEFLDLRAMLKTRALQENNSIFGWGGKMLAIGSIVKCELRGNTWWVIDGTERKHPAWQELTDRIKGSKASSGQAAMEQHGGGGSCGPGCSRHPGNAAYGTGASGGAGYAGSQQSSKKPPKNIANPASNCNVPIEGRALLDMIAFNESRGAYNIRYGGDQAIEVTDFSDHPRKKETITRGYNAGEKSSAAGRYQFIEKTWDRIAKQENITDFSPESQDQAAWALAVADYKTKTKGRNLLHDLKNGSPESLNRIGRALSATWTSLPGSTSGEQLTSDSQFVEGYNNLLQNQEKIQVDNEMPCMDEATGTPEIEVSMNFS